MGDGGMLSGVAKVLMYECNRHAALAHRGGDSFHRAEPHVPAREDARDAGLEEIRVALMRPAIRCTHVGPGEDEAALIELDLGWEPARLGVRPDEEK